MATLRLDKKRGRGKAILHVSQAPIDTNYIGAMFGTPKRIPDADWHVRHIVTSYLIKSKLAKIFGKLGNFRS